MYPQSCWAQNTPGCSQAFGRSAKYGTQAVGLCRAAMGADRLALEASAKGLRETFWQRIRRNQEVGEGRRAPWGLLRWRWSQHSIAAPRTTPTPPPSDQLKLELPGFPARLCGRCGISPGRSCLPSLCISNPRPLRPSTPAALQSPSPGIGGGCFSLDTHTHPGQAQTPRLGCTVSLMCLEGMGSGV